MSNKVGGGKTRSGLRSLMILSVVVLLTASVIVLSDDNNAAGAGDGTAASPYIITDAAGLAQLAAEVNAGDAKAGKYYVLGNDIDLSTYGNWTPIGTNATNSFKGTFDGAGYTISGLFINNASRDYAGLFGYVFTGALIKDVFIKGASVTAKTYVGGLVGYLNNASVVNCHVSGTVAGHDRVGGVVGSVFVSSSGIIGCSFNGSVRGAGSGSAFDSIGGVAGWMNGSKISQSWATGTVQGRDDVGGVVGYLSSGATPAIVENCYFIGDVNGRNNVGGLIGDLNPFDNTNNLITKSYAVGTVTGTKNVGGIAGYLGNGNVTNCAALNQSVSASGSDAGRVIGSMAATMTGQMTGNVAFSGMNVTGTGPSAENGMDINATEINTDGMMGNRFTDPWITEDGKLPSFTAPIDMPLYLIPKDITAAMFNDISPLVYNVTAQTPSVTLSGVDPKVTFTIVEYINNVNAGTASVTVRGTANYTGTATLTFTILKATPDPAIPSGLTAVYGQKLSDILLPVSGTAGWTWNAPGTSVGDFGMKSFPATFTPANTMNYETISVNLEVYVGKASVIMPAAESGLVYNGSPQDGVKYDKTLEFYTVSGTVSATDAGGYTAVFTLKDSNHMWSDGSTADITLTWTIAAATAAATLSVDDIVYGDSLVIDIENVIPSGLSDWLDIWSAYKTEFLVGGVWTTVEPADIGTYSVRMVFTESVGNNYTGFTTPAVGFRILPFEVEMPAIIPGIIANGSEQTGIDYDDTLEFYTLSGPVSATNAGEYTAIFKLKNENYVWSNGSKADLELKWTIAAAKASAKLSVADITYGDPFTYDVTNVDPASLSAVWWDTWDAYTVEFRAGGVWTTVEPKDVGTYSVRILFTESVGGTYADFMTEPEEFKILPATPTPAIPSGLTAVYGQTLGDVSLPTGWAWNDPLTTNVGNVGTRSFPATFTPSDTLNYISVSENLDVNVIRASVIMPQIVPGLVYVPPGFLLTGVNYDDPSDYYTASGVLSATLAGQYTAVFTLKDNSNYQWMNGSTAPLSLVWTIGAATLSPSSAVLRANDIVYGNSIDWSIGVTDPEFLTWFSPAGTIFEYSTDDNIWTTVEPADAGTYYMRVIFTQSVGGDFADFMTNTVRFTISPIAVDMPTIIPGFVYDGSTEYEGIDYDEFSTLYALVPGSVVSAKNAGSYRAVFTLDDKNYMWSDGTTADLELIWTIGMYPTAATLSVADIVYGEELVAIIIVDPFDGWWDIWPGYKAEFLVGGVWTTVEPTDVGTYSLRLLFTESIGNNYADIMTNTAEFKILPFEVAMPTIILGLVYDYGNEVAGINYDKDLKFYTRSGDVSAVNAGDYTAVFKLKDKNYVWSDDSKTDLTLTWTISADTTSATLSVDNIIYGDELVITVYVDPALLSVWWDIWPYEKMKIEFLVGGAWTDVEPTDAGAYSVRIKFTESKDNNYVDFTTSTADFKILPAKAAMPTAVTGLIYNESPQIGVNYNSASAIYELSSGTASETNVGNYSATFKITDTNYVWMNGSSADLTLTWTIGEAIPSYVLPSDMAAVYGQTLNDMPPLPAGWAWNDPLTTKVGDVGTNYFVATYTPADTNYLPAVGAIGINVTGLPVEMPKINTGLVYNGSMRTGVDYNASSVFYTMNTGSVVSARDTGSYQASFTLKNENYIWANGSEGILTLTWTISTTNITAKIGAADIYYGGELVIKVTEIDGVACVPQILLDDWNIWGAYTVEFLVGGVWTIVEPKNAGTYSVRVLFTESVGHNYVDLLTAPASFEIMKATSTTPGYPSYAVPSGLTAVYGQTLSDVPLPAGWTWDAPGTSVGDFGTRSFPATFTPSDTANYETVSASLSVNVTRAPVVMPTVKYGLIFDGSDQTGINYDPSAPYSLVPGTFASGTAAGQYTATFRLANGNYQWTDGSTSDLALIWTIGNSAIDTHTFSATLNVSDKVYGAPLPIDIGVVGVSVWSAIISQYSSDGVVWTETEPTDVGTYFMRIIFAQNPGSVYADYITNVAQFEIEPKALSDELQPVAGTFVYNGLPQTPAAVVIGGLVAGVDYDVSYSNNTRTGEATLIITGKGNYTGTLSEKFTITPKPITVIPVSGHSKVAGEEDPALAYAVSGLVGHDNLSGALAREPGEDPGEYLILLGSLSHPDYAISFTGDIVFIVEEKIEHDPYASAYWLLFMFGFLAGAMIARYVWRRLYGEG